MFSDTDVTNETDITLQSIMMDNTNIYQNDMMNCNMDNEVFIQNCNIDGADISQQGVCNLKTSSTAKADVNKNMASDERSKVKQLNQTVTQAMSLNPGSTTASNVVKLSENAISDIETNISQNCLADLSGVNKFTCKDYSGKAVGGYFDQKDQLDAFSHCAMSASVGDTSSAALKAVVEQTAIAEQQNAIFWILVAASAATASYYIMQAMGGTSMAREAIMAIVALLVFVAVVQWAIGKIKQKKDYRDMCGDCSMFTDESSCTKHLCEWDSATNSCECNPNEQDCSSQCYLQYDKDACTKHGCGWNPDTNRCTGDPKWCPPK